MAKTSQKEPVKKREIQEEWDQYDKKMEDMKEELQLK